MTLFILTLAIFGSLAWLGRRAEKRKARPFSAAVWRM